jgi:hypothetical protein
VTEAADYSSMPSRAAWHRIKSFTGDVMKAKREKRADSLKREYRLEIREIAVGKAAFIVRVSVSDRELGHIIGAISAKVKMPNPFHSAGTSL